MFTLTLRLDYSLRLNLNESIREANEHKNKVGATWRDNMHRYLSRALSFFRREITCLPEINIRVYSSRQMAIVYSFVPVLSEFAEKSNLFGGLSHCTA